MTKKREQATVSESATAVTLFWSLAADLMTEDARVVEGTIMNGRCLRVGEEFLALVDYKESGLVVKLSKHRVDELIASGVGQPFSPAGKRFKEWVSVPEPDRRRWRALLREGVSLHGRGGGVKGGEAAEGHS